MLSTAWPHFIAYRRPSGRHTTSRAEICADLTSHVPAHRFNTHSDSTESAMPPISAQPTFKKLTFQQIALHR